MVLKTYQVWGPTAAHFRQPGGVQKPPVRGKAALLLSSMSSLWILLGLRIPLKLILESCNFALDLLGAQGRTA